MADPRTRALRLGVGLVFACAPACLAFDDHTELEGYCVDDASGRFVQCADGGEASADARSADAAPDAELADGGRLDAGVFDADVADFGPQDTGVRDAEPLDIGLPDAEAPDAEAPDLGPPDSGPLDLGPADAGLVEVTLAPDGPGRILAPAFSQDCSSTCSFFVPVGAVLQVEAVAETGAELDTWTQPSACLGAGATCTVTVGASAVTVGADFVLLQYTLTVQITPAAPDLGAVRGPGALLCPGSCNGTFAHGTQVQLDAEPAPGARLVRWLGDCTGASPSCTVTMDRAKTVVAEYASVPPLVTNGQAADLVLGQPDFTSSGVPQPPTGSSMDFPLDCATDAGGLLVSDSLNNRVLRWFTVPTTSGQSADLALGQSNLVSGGSRPPSQTSMSPSGLAVYGSRLYVAGNSRVLVWDPLPTRMGEAAALYLGQPAWTTTNSPQQTTADTFLARSVMAWSGGLGIVDRNRVLLWQPQPTTSGLVAASTVVGQPDTITIAPASPPSLASLNTAYDAVVDPRTGRFAVSDALNHRVLFWNQVPTSDGQPADVVLGQTTPTGRNPDAGLPNVNAIGMFTPRGVHFTADSLLVSDFGNQRVMIWTPVPVSDGAPATAVLGAADLTSPGEGRPRSTGIVAPSGICQAGTALFVVDSGANRVLRYVLSRP